jgi:hypothetical protein
MHCVFPQEQEALEMLAGLRPRTSEAWVEVCLKNLHKDGLCTVGPNYHLTDEGRTLLEQITGFRSLES